MLIFRGIFLWEKGDAMNPEHAIVWNSALPNSLAFKKVFIEVCRTACNGAACWPLQNVPLQSARFHFHKTSHAWFSTLPPQIQWSPSSLLETCHLPV